MKKFLLILFVSCLLSACQSAKDALTLKKKNSSDEFLIEKKSPLVLPPSYGELPLPSDAETIIEDNNEITFSNENIKINESVDKSEPSSLEKSIVDKIK
tara:strand:- start:47 stop:343 length:297 start_codon:yes stop_codon:yes gene_type:complete